MALPTLQPYYLTKRNAAAPENIIVRRRTQQRDFKEAWSRNAQYFNQSDVSATKANEWTSTKAFQESMDAYHNIIEKEEKIKRLQERRKKLQIMLEDERLQLAAELEEQENDVDGRLSQMKDRAEELKSARERERKVLANKKLHEHWRNNNPDIRKLEMKQFEKSVQGNWSSQINEKKKQREVEEQEKALYEEAMERERMEVLRQERKQKEQKKIEEKGRAAILQSQMQEIRERQAEAALMEQQRSALLKEQAELEKAELRLKEMEEQRKKSELGRVLVRQAKAQLRRKSQRVQEELELDLRILEGLVSSEKEENALRTARRDKARADAEWMQDVVRQQLQLEKEREAELDIMYQEEALRMWNKREAEWEKERQARERLMNDVLAERQKQIDTKIELLEEKQAESIQRREDLLQELEYDKQLTRRDRENASEAVTHRAKELKEQVVEKKRQAEKAKKQYQLQLQEQRRMEEEFEELMRIEEDAITARGYQPQEYGKKKYAWM